MATGIGNLPYTMPPVSPFDVITSQAENERIANIESLADGTGIGDNAITASKLGPTTFQSPNYTGGGTGITVNSYTAPSNGYLNVRAVVNTTAASGATVSINATEVYKLSYSGPTGGYNIQSTAVIPIRSGQVATFSVTNASWDLRVFRAAIPV